LAATNIVHPFKSGPGYFRLGSRLRTWTWFVVRAHDLTYLALQDASMPLK
jgi:hypothetical protein